MQSEENDNELVNLFVRFKHPFLTLSEYDQFKIRIWQNDSVVSTLSPPVLEELKEIMETDWHYGKLRRILQVKKPNHDQASFY